MVLEQVGAGYLFFGVSMLEGTKHCDTLGRIPTRCVSRLFHPNMDTESAGDGTMGGGGGEWRGGEWGRREGGPSPAFTVSMLGGRPCDTLGRIRPGVSQGSSSPTSTRRALMMVPWVKGEGNGEGGEWGRKGGRPSPAFTVSMLRGKGLATVWVGSDPVCCKALPPQHGRGERW